MNNYELTERGRIILTVVLVALLLLVPFAIIYGASTCIGSSPPEDASSDPPPGDEDFPVLSITPPPSGSGVDSLETPPVSETPNPADDTNPTEPPEEPPVYGPIGIDTDNEVMAFIFSPDEQNTIDNETAAMIEDFLSLPGNTQNSLIKIEIPNINAEDKEIFYTAIEQAFAEYNISDNDLLYVPTDVNVTDKHFEVVLSYTSSTPVSTGQK